MKLFDVYSLFNITPVRARGSWLWDDKGERYLDFYGGHAVISIGHCHPHYVKALTDQLNRIGFYSNSVQNPLVKKFSEMLGHISGYDNYQLFLCNTGAEANENALKLASFFTGRRKVIAFRNSFHGRTSGAVAATDNPKIAAPYNTGHDILFLPMNDEKALSESLGNNVSSIIIEGIQGVGGIKLPDDSFLKFIEKKCAENGSLLILDEIQSGYGRTGKFFAHQHAGIKPHLITMAKGMGNGFPVGGVMIHPDIKPWSGMLGTTFGGNYLASAAGLAVLQVIEQEKLLNNASEIGKYIVSELKAVTGIVELRGRGLMIGIDLPEYFSNVRDSLLYNHHIFTGEAKPNTVRLLPSLAITVAEANIFLKAFKEELNELVVS